MIQWMKPLCLYTQYNNVCLIYLIKLISTSIYSKKTLSLYNKDLINNKRLLFKKKSQ